jgi:hypothetical protein
MNTYLCNIYGILSHKSGRSEKALRKRIRATLLEQYGRYDDKRINIKLVRNPHEGRGNSITDQLRHI